MNNFFDLSERIAIITGGGSGLGKGIARGYAEYGAKVAVVDIKKDKALETVDIIKSSGGEAIAIQCNVAKTEEVKKTVAEIMNRFGEIDILVNCAGIGRRAKAEEMTDEMWDNVIDVNLKGTFLFCREVGREMIKAQGGNIINIASIAGVVGVKTGNANYAASKGGQIAMSRCLALEWTDHDILVNTIAPSHIKTPLIKKLMKEKPETKEYFLNNIPLGRLGEVRDVVGAAIFLASDASGFITGHTLLVDGGHTVK